MWARSAMLTQPGSVPGNASRELLVFGHNTHNPVGQERNKTLRTGEEQDIKDRRGTRH